MPQFKHIVIVAGEESGDKYASEIIQALKKKDKSIKFSGIGGQHMSASGAELISDLAKFGVTGLTEVIRHFCAIKKAFDEVKKHLMTIKPQLLILIDYPGFNLRLAKFAKQKLGLKIIYYISPQVWAWKKNRIKTIKNTVDHMAVILPFEKKIYEQAGIRSSFVGHPLIKRIDAFNQKHLSKSELQIPRNKKILALLPGSRLNEVNQHLPILIKAIKILCHQKQNIHLVIPVAKSLDKEVIINHFKSSGLEYSLLDGHALDAASHADAVVVASGTASLECALLCNPMCIIYKTSPITYLIASQLIQVKYLGLSNLLLNKMIVPELLQYDFTAHNTSEVINQLLCDENFRAKIIRNLQKLRSSLSIHEADTSIDELIYKELINK